MPDSVVVQCKECKLFQVIPQLLPVKDGAYFNCESCPSKKTGEPSRQPCVVQKMPDGKVLRSYDVEEMRKQAKKLNASGTSERQDARMSSQKSRILHTLEEQRLRRIQARAPRHRSPRRARRLTVRACHRSRRSCEKMLSPRRCSTCSSRRTRSKRWRRREQRRAAANLAHGHVGMHVCARGCRTESLLLDSKSGDIDSAVGGL